MPRVVSFMGDVFAEGMADGREVLVLGLGVKGFRFRG